MTKEELNACQKVCTHLQENTTANFTSHLIRSQSVQPLRVLSNRRRCFDGGKQNLERLCEGPQKVWQDKRHSSQENHF